MSDTDFVQTILNSLTDEQRAAATSEAKSILVRAGAGTGKTRTLIARIAFLIGVKKVSPENILCVTYTSKAAQEIRERISSIFGSTIAARLGVGTFHAVAFRILRTYKGLIPTHDHRFFIIDRTDSLPYVKNAIVDCGLFPDPKETDTEARKALTEIAGRYYDQIASWKYAGLTAKMTEADDRPTLTPDQESTARVYRTFQFLCWKKSVIDFADMILCVVQAMKEREDLRSLISHSISHLLVDEAQDASPPQVEFARLLSIHHKNIFVVGDEDQSIFSFQGAHPDGMRQIAGADAKDFTLTENKRSTNEVLQPAVTLVNWNRRAKQKSLVSKRMGEKPTVNGYITEAAEATNIAASIQDLRRSGVRIQDIAILARSYWVVAPLEEALLKAAIPYRLLSGRSLLDREEVRDITAYMRLVYNPQDATPFGRIFNKPTRGLGASTEHEVLKLVETQGIDVTRALRRLTVDTSPHLSEKNRSAAYDLGEKLDKLVVGYHEQGMQTHDIMQYILEDDGIGYASFLSREAGKDARKKMKNIQMLQRIAHAEPEVADFLSVVAMSGAGLEDETGGLPSVSITTIHQSKGLEWQHVFMPGFDAAVIPSPKSREANKIAKPSPWLGVGFGGIEEERRLAHVGFTRAKDCLHISYPLRRNGRPSLPSVFLGEADLLSVGAPGAFGDNDPFFHDAKIISRHGSRERAGRKGGYRSKPDGEPSLF